MAIPTLAGEIPYLSTKQMIEVDQGSELRGSESSWASSIWPTSACRRPCTPRRPSVSTSSRSSRRTTFSGCAELGGKKSNPIFDR